MQGPQNTLVSAVAIKQQHVTVCNTLWGLLGTEHTQLSHCMLGLQYHIPTVLGRVAQALNTPSGKPPGGGALLPPPSPAPPPLT